jgi:diguanylate cyclase (GGDEF)-like protein
MSVAGGAWLRRAGIVCLACAGLAGQALPLPAATPPGEASVLFERVGDLEQVPDGVITALVQDAHGLLWIGTTDGLIRYDGYRFRRYVHDPARADSLPGNRIQTLLASSDGRLWVGTYSHGVAVFDAERESFEALVPPERPQPGQPPSTVRAMAETPDGCVWVGSAGAGLARLCGDGSQRRFPGGNGSDLNDDRISALEVDRAGDLWIGSWRGLSRLRRGQTRFESVLSEPDDPASFAGTTIRGIHATVAGDLWIGAQQGRMARIPAALLGREQPPQADEVQRWLGNGLNAAAEPGDGTLWVAHAGGIDVYALDGTDPLRQYRHRAVDPLSIANAEVRSLLLDRSGWIWAGTFGGGLQRVNPRAGALQSRRFDPIDDAPLTQFSVVTLSGASDGGLWAGVTLNGVVRLDSDLVIREVMAFDAPGSGALSGRHPAGIAEAADGSLWVATERGLFVRRAGHSLFELGASPDFLEGANVRRLWADNDGHLWIATGDGLFVRDPDGALRRLAAADGSAVRGGINALAMTEQEAWVGGGSGLYRLDHDTGSLHVLHRVTEQGPILADVLGLLLDARGRLWMDAGGLYLLQSVIGDVAHFEAISRRHGHADVSFGANLLDDAQGRIWTHRFVYDPDHDLFQRLGRAEGAQVGTGWFRAYARMADGRLVFGASEGLLTIRPELFEHWRFNPPLVFTELRIDGELHPIGPRAHELLLGPGESAFTLEFASLDFTAPEVLRYRYRLLGLDEVWVEADSNARVASFGGLWPGEYRLQVEGSNRSGHYSPDSLELMVRVLPHWWQTPWALLLGILTLIAAILLLMRLRERRLRQAKQRLEAEVQARTVDLQALSSALARKNLDFEQASLTDPLTGLRNRRFAMQEMPKEVSLCLRRIESRGASSDEAADLVLFMIDLDHFKSVNDCHGHAIGDMVLCQFAERLREVFRGSDHLVRWGGEEFLVVARDTQREGAAELAERLRRRMADEPFVVEGLRLRRTACIGFAPFPLLRSHPRACGWEDVVDLADQLLYACKRAGRDAWIGIFPERADPSPLICQNWSDPARVRAGQARLFSSLPEHRALAAMGEQMEAMVLGV